MRTLQRWRKENGKADKRKGAIKIVHNKLSQAEHDRLLKFSNNTKYRDLPPCKIVPLIADEGEYIASERTFYRYLKAARQLTHRQRSSSKIKSRPKMLTASKPNKVWSWDITYLSSSVRGRYYYLYLIVDVYSRYIVGWRIHESENSYHAAQLMRECCIKHNINPGELALHSDNGSPMKGATMLATLEKLGVAASFSRPAVSNDNPYSESLFRTLKYCNGTRKINAFENIGKANAWVDCFVNWYNKEHLHSAIKYVTPESRHKKLDLNILRSRHEVYTNARIKKPHRWNGRKTRNWRAVGAVSLNPSKEPAISLKRKKVFMHKPTGQEQGLNSCA